MNNMNIQTVAHALEIGEATGGEKLREGRDVTIQIESPCSRQAAHDRHLLRRVSRRALDHEEGGSRATERGQGGEGAAVQQRE
jgi:hypothetical protein